MVTVEFIPDWDEIREDVDGAEVSDLKAALTWTMFDVPVRLVVDGRDVWETPSGAPPRQPLVHLAVHGLDKVRALERESTVRYDPPSGGALTMTRTDDEVRLTYAPSGTTASVPYAELRHAFEDFAVRVRAFVSAQLPLIHQS